MMMFEIKKNAERGEKPTIPGKTSAIGGEKRERGAVENVWSRVHEALE